MKPGHACTSSADAWVPTALAVTFILVVCMFSAIALLTTTDAPLHPHSVAGERWHSVVTRCRGESVAGQDRESPAWEDGTDPPEPVQSFAGERVGVRGAATQAISRPSTTPLSHADGYDYFMRVMLARYSNLPGHTKEDGTFCLERDPSLVQEFFSLATGRRALLARDLYTLPDRWSDAAMLYVPHATDDDPQHAREVLLGGVPAAHTFVSTVYAVLPFAARSYHSAHSRSNDGGGVMIQSTHATADRVLTGIAAKLRVWQGPVSIAVLIKSDAEEEALLHLARSNGAMRRFVDVHLVRCLSASEVACRVYPFNLLRNIALMHTRCGADDWMLLTDFDMLELSSSAAHLGEIKRSEHRDASWAGTPCPQLRMYVVPSLSLNQSAPLRASPLLASRIDTLLQEFGVLSTGGSESQLRNAYHACVSAYERGELVPMESGFPFSYFPTRYDLWKRTTAPYGVEYSWSFEPNVITRRGVLPFEEMWAGRGWDAISHSFMSHAVGYSFMVVPRLVAVNLPIAGVERQLTLINTAALAHAMVESARSLNLRWNVTHIAADDLRAFT